MDLPRLRAAAGRRPSRATVDLHRLRAPLTTITSPSTPSTALSICSPGSIATDYSKRSKATSSVRARLSGCIRESDLIPNPQCLRLITDRRMMNDLDGIPVRILEVAGPRAVAMRARLRVDRDAVALEKRRPCVDIFRPAHDEPEMIQRVHALL